MENIMEMMASIQEAIKRMEAELKMAEAAVPPSGSDRHAYIMRLERRMNKAARGTGFVPSPRERRDMKEFRDAVERVKFLQSAINAEKGRIEAGEAALTALDFLNGNTDALSWLKGREEEDGWVDAETQRARWVSRVLDEAKEAGYQI